MIVRKHPRIMLALAGRDNTLINNRRFTLNHTAENGKYEL
jgi:hypothetical protein